MGNSILYVVATAVAICVVAMPITVVGDGWIPLPVIDAPKVQRLGKWAVVEYDKEIEDKLKFNRVVSGEENMNLDRPELGVKYRLVIDASDGNGKATKYEAVLAEQVWLDRITLISFNPAS